jgi:hypothetical protein
MLRLVVFFAFGFAVVIGLPAESKVEARGPDSLRVVWACPTNSWPDKLWVYKVVAQEFAEPVLSNLLHIGSYTMKDRTKVPPYFAEKDAKTLFFGDIEGIRKHLAICPTLGFIDYFDHNAESVGNDPVVGVPDQQRATHLALGYLRLAGIDRSQIATKPGTTELDLHWSAQRSAWLDQTTKTEVTVTNRLTVFFRRRIDGLNVGGIALNGGFLVGFGNHERIVELQVYWRNLKPYQIHDCATPDEIVDWLRTRKIALPSAAGSPDQIRMLTINYASPFYAANFGDQREDFISPKLDIIVTVENPKGSAPVQFQAPIFKSGG